MVLQQGNYICGDVSRWLHFCGGDRGGVGKTLFCKVLISYYVRSRRACIVYDADRANLDVYRSQGGKSGELVEIYRCGFSEDPERAEISDEILYAVLDKERNKDVIVNLPAGISPIAIKWWAQCRGIDLTLRNGVQPICWFLTGGDNLQLIDNSIKNFSVFHVLVKNLHLRSKWDVFDDFMERSGFVLPTIEMERLSRSVADVLSTKNLLLDDATDELKLLEASRLNYFTETMHGRLENFAKNEMERSGVRLLPGI